jgi:hypothetical protein
MFDIAAAKKRLSITGATQDAELEVALSTAISIAERWCDRGLIYAVEKVVFTHVLGKELSLPRFPVESIISLSTKNQNSLDYHLNYQAGFIIFHPGLAAADELTIEYAAGYKNLPLDLELALWLLFDVVWGQLSGGSASVTVGGGEVTSISVPDVGTIRFSASSSRSSSDSSSDSGIIPAPAISLLRPYLRITC